MKIEFRKQIDSDAAPWQPLTNIDELIWNGVFNLRVTDDNGSHGLPFHFANEDIVTIVVKDHTPNASLPHTRTTLQEVTRVECATGKAFIYTRTRHTVDGVHIWGRWIADTELPVATRTFVGGIMIGDGLSINAEGRVSVDGKTFDGNNFDKVNLAIYTNALNSQLSGNLFNKNAAGILVESIFSDALGGITGSTTHNVTDYIAVVPGEMYACNNLEKQPFGYGLDKDFVTAIEPAGSTIVIPEGVYWVRLSYPRSLSDTFCLNKGSSFLSSGQDAFGLVRSDKLYNGAVTKVKLSPDLREMVEKIDDVVENVPYVYKRTCATKTDIELVVSPARLDNLDKNSDGFGGYRYDLSNAYAEGWRYIRFRGSNYTLTSDIVRGLIVDVDGNVETYIETSTEKTNGWNELPLTEKSSYLKASYVKYIYDTYGENFTPEYIELIKNEGKIIEIQESLVGVQDAVVKNQDDIANLQNEVVIVKDEIAPIINSANIESVNLLNLDDLLTGYSLASGQIVTKDDGIFSNRLTLETGKTYTIKDVPLFYQGPLSAATTAIYIAKYNAEDAYIGRDVVKPTSIPADNYVTVTYTPTDSTASYYRVVLQSGLNQENPFDPTRAMIYEGTTDINEFIPYSPTLIFNYDKVQDERISNLESLINGGNEEIKEGGILLTGASFAYSANTWFAKVCESLNKNAYNKAVSGESIKNTAIKMFNDALYSKAEFEDFDTLLIMHVHNQDVCNETDLQENYADYEVSASMSYSQAYDYVLKKYAAECYAAKDDSTSKWYGTQYGKPCKVVCVTHWHDARTVFNDSIRRLREKWGFGLVELDKNIGFSKNQLHPVTGAQISVIHAQDTEVIDGITYGWHPSRATGAYIQDRIAEVVVDMMK